MYHIGAGITSHKKTARHIYYILYRVNNRNVVKKEKN